MTPDLAWWGRLAVFLAAQTALLAGAATIVNYRIRAPQARRAVWQAVLLAVACVWLGETAGLGEKARALWPREGARIVQAAGQFASVTAPPAAAQAEPPPPAHREGPAAPVTWPAEVWLLGTSLLLLRAAANRGWLAWQRRRMAPADVETQEAVARLCVALGLSGVEARIWARLRGPVAFGWRRPTVALPRAFSLRFTPVQREAMLAHELAHLAARDPLWLALADTVCALAWWNPPAWWAATQLRAASEAAADEASALVPAGPAALAESLLRFGRELAESGPARGLGVAGNGFRSGLGRRVHALLTSPVRWRELPAVWRWSPRIAALLFVLALTLLPVLSGPSGSVFGLLVQSAQAQPAGLPSQEAPRLIVETGVMDDSNFPPTILPVGASNGAAASNTVVLEVKMASVLDGSPGPAALDKLIGHLPPDQSAGPDAVAQFLREGKISHTNYLRMDYLVAKNEAATLTSAQFKAILESFEQSDGCDVLSLPRATVVSRGLTHLSVEDILELVTDVEVTSNGPASKAITVKYMTDALRTGAMAQLWPTASPQGWNLSIMARMTEFLGYDNPGHAEKRYTLPLPRLRVAEIQGGGTVRVGETLALRGPAYTQTNRIKGTVLWFFHPTRTKIVRGRYYVFVTPISETK